MKETLLYSFDDVEEEFEDTEYRTPDYRPPVGTPDTVVDTHQDHRYGQ